MKVGGKTIPELVKMDFTDLYSYLGGLDTEIARPMVTKMKQILSHLINIGVGYLSLDRPVSTLSGGESQRVKMARQLDCDLVGLMYILDEPSIGLHPRDNHKLIEILKELRNKGNSVFVVEHDPDIIRCADYIIDVGPRAGANGGEIIYSGPFAGLAQSKGLTAEFLNNRSPVAKTRKPWTKYIEIKNASLNNLKNISTKIPKGVLTCVTGVAGSGKSSLINDVFLNQNRGAIVIDQSPIGKSSRSNPATYAVSSTKCAGNRGQNPHQRFSVQFQFRGRLPEMQGTGTHKHEMNFLDEVRVVCDECQGKRYTEKVLAIRYNGKKY